MPSKKTSRSSRNPRGGDPGGVTVDACRRMGRVCASMKLRTLSRQVTRHYDKYLEPTGVTAAQLPLLSFLFATSGATMSRISEVMLLERSTLSRNLGVLKRNGLIVVEERRGPVSAHVRLTPKGKRALDRAWRAWNEAHAEVEGVVAQRRLREAFETIELLAVKLDQPS